MLNVREIDGVAPSPNSHIGELLIRRARCLNTIERSRHPNLTILRTIPSADGNSLTIFIKNTTYSDDIFDLGYLAVCEKVAPTVATEGFFLSIPYHEWCIIEPNPIFAACCAPAT